MICHDLDLVFSQVAQALLQARVRPENVDLVVRTGGSSSIPSFVDRLEHRFGPDRVIESPLTPQSLWNLGSACEEGVVVSRRMIRPPKLKDLRRKRSKKTETTKTAREIGAMSVPDDVGEAQTIVEHRRRTALTEVGINGSDGVIATVRVSSSHRRSRRLDIPLEVREQYGLNR